MATAIMADGMIYQYSILYNYYEGPSNRMDADHRLAREYVKKLNLKLGRRGFTKSYYYDKFLPGTNIFTEMNKVISQAEKVVLILTREFFQNCWHNYSQQSCMKRLIDDGNTSRLLPLAVAMERGDIPENLGFDLQTVIYFNNDEQSDEDNWDRIYKSFIEKPPIQAERRNIQTTVQASDASSGNFNRQQQYSANNVIQQDDTDDISNHDTSPSAATNPLDSSNDLINESISSLGQALAESSISTPTSYTNTSIVLHTAIRPRTAENDISIAQSNHDVDLEMDSGEHSSE